MASGCSEDNTTKVENTLRGPVVIADSSQRMNLEQRMQHYKAPAVSIAVINGSAIDFAKAYGNHVAPNTLFQAASISKMLNAFGILTLVRQGKVDLDKDVNQYLKRWKIKHNEHYKETDKITLRQILSHSAGFSISGFPGYEVNRKLPSILQVLNGDPDVANTKPVEVIYKPGVQFKYSGGGTTVSQLVLEDVTGAGEYAEFDKFLGIKTPTLRKIAKKYQDLPFPVIKYFLHSKFNEERLFALIVLVMQYQKADAGYCEDIFQFYLKNIGHVNNWNLVDNSAHHIVGAHLWGRDRAIFLKLARSKNLWERRISIVATWYFIKQQDFEYTTHISKLLLNDEEDLMHKACGWMLREVGKQNQESLINFLDLYANLMPRTMLRYAIEKFSDPLRKQYLLCK